MKREDTLGDIIAFAIRREEDGAAFYEAAAERAEDPAMRSVLAEMAAEERAHALQLRRLLDAPDWRDACAAVVDVDVPEITDPDDMADAEFDAVLIRALRSEVYTQRLYAELAEVKTDPALKELFAWLAEQEGAHRKRFSDALERRERERG